MKKENRNLYITDLDGTLLNNKAELSKTSKKAIELLVENDIKFTVATARSVVSVQQMFEDIDLKLPIIEFNGAFISDLKTGKHITINNIKDDIYKSIINNYHGSGINCFISTYDGSGDNLYYEKITNAGNEWYIRNRIENNDKRLKETKSIKDIKNESVVCITMIDTYEKLKEIYNDLIYIEDIEMHLQDNMYSPGWYWLTIHSSKATKDKAIKELVNMMGYEDFKLHVFGDNSNDIKMFNIANKSLAVTNAIDELKDIADEIIESNTEDGVVKYILEKENIASNIYTI